MRKFNFNTLLRSQETAPSSNEPISVESGIVSAPEQTVQPQITRRSGGAYRTILNNHRAMSERIDRAEQEVQYTVNADASQP